MWDKVAVIVPTAVLTVVALYGAFYFGYRAGYWTRVDEEKLARGIR